MKTLTKVISVKELINKIEKKMLRILRLCGLSFKYRSEKKELLEVENSYWIIRRACCLYMKHSKGTNKNSQWNNTMQTVGILFIYKSMLYIKHLNYITLFHLIFNLLINFMMNALVFNKQNNWYIFIQEDDSFM